MIKRAQYFVSCNGARQPGLIDDPQWVISSLISSRQYETLKKMNSQSKQEQLSLFDVERFEVTKRKEARYAN